MLCRCEQRNKAGEFHERTRVAAFRHHSFNARIQRRKREKPDCRIRKARKAARSGLAREALLFCVRFFFTLRDLGL